MRIAPRLVLPVLLLALVGAAAHGEGSASAGRKRAAAPPVVVPHGRPVQIAYVGTTDLPTFTESFRNAIQMAIEDHPTVRGFPIQVDELDAPCQSGPDTAAANAAVAARIVSNPQILGVLGHPCSAGERAALPLYEAAGVVAVSGSASAADLPGLAPTVFDRTIVSDPDGENAWYATVATLPSDLAFVEDYEAEFGVAPTAFADLTYDAASLLLRRLSQVSRLDKGGNLVVDRGRLASAVRATRWYQGVSCRVTLDGAGNRVNDPAALAGCAEG